MPSAMPPEGAIRHRVRVSGIVQGVGFRPFVHNLAIRWKITGRVRNVAGGVHLEVQGQASNLAEFLDALRHESPPLSAIETIDIESIPALADERDFAIEASEGAALPTPIPPDIAVCEACLAELRDPNDRRYRYPFLNCTDCGPRLTIIERLPYDREQTTMRKFVMCARCWAEYEDPTSRRFHAQPNACPDCGPSVGFLDLSLAMGDPRIELRGEEALAAAGAALDAGRIVAIQGIGGFHLACDATSETAVACLRARKGRGGKPFALMVSDVQAARRFAGVTADEATLLESRERPIVLLQRLDEVQADHAGTVTSLAPSVAPRQATLGLLLPYSPLHHLLIAGRTLVMTSGNRSEEPICREPAEAIERLGGIADAFLLHDRPIHVVCDDSVVRVFAGRELPLRRSRGYAPFPILLPREAPPLLAVGAELKSTFCLTQGKRAFLSQHLGDLANLETLAAFERLVDHLTDLFRIEPQAVAADLHPAYLSTRFAERYAQERGVPLVRVQHHHAHIAAVLAEHGHRGEEPVIGVSFDGTGYGTDGAIWGGEVLIADFVRAERFAHLGEVPLPGGDAAVRYPHRMALAHLRAAGTAWDSSLPPVAVASAAELRILDRQLSTGFATVRTTSMGRLFDAVASLVGLCHHAEFEGEAAMALEAAAADLVESPRYRFDLREAASAWVFDPAPVFAEIVADLAKGVPVARISAHFHDAVARAIVELCERARTQAGIQTVALSGGVFQNVKLLGLAVRGLERAGFIVLTHRRVPPNDGGLALGQAVIAGYGKAR